MTTKKLSFITIGLCLIGIGFFIPCIQQELMEYYGEQNEQLMKKFVELEKQVNELQKLDY